MKRYYKAYDDRYKAVHKEGLLWSITEPAKELIRWIKINRVPKTKGLYDVGCGEGRDAIFLAKEGYKIFAVDVSKAAIKKCKTLSRGLNITWKVADVLKYIPDKKFDFVYSDGVLHMFVLDEDRKCFLKNICRSMNSGGKAFILIKGDGKTRFRTDISKAFEKAKRIHPKTGDAMQITTTSYRSVTWDDFRQELTDVGFRISKTKDCIDEDQGQSMIVYLEKE